LSISYARDFFAPDLRRCYRAPDYVPSPIADKDEDEEEEEDEEDKDEEYSNLEGLYASKSVSAGDVVLMEDEMPDCAVRGEKLTEYNT